jgi:hypothetical protein
MPPINPQQPPAKAVVRRVGRAMSEGGWLAQALPLLLLALLAGHAADDAQSLQLSALLQLAGSVLLLLSVACCKIGVWRVANRRAQHAGASATAWALRALVLAGGLAFGLAFAERHGGARTFEMGQIALGQDPVAVVDARISADGRSLLLSGTLGAGSADKVHELLANAPGVRLVRLQSAGGRLFEAESIAADIRQRRLNTYVDGLCASACTMVLLAGRQRGAAPNARIGFHRPSFAGVDDDRTVDADALMRYYRSAGIARAFVEKVRATSSQSMWFPTRQELERHRVLTPTPPGGGLLALR